MMKNTVVGRPGTSMATRTNRNRMTTLLSVISGTRHAWPLARHRRMLRRLNAIATTPTTTPTAGPTPPAIPSTGRTQGKTMYVSRHRVPEITIERLKRRAASFSSPAGARVGVVGADVVTACVGFLTDPQIAPPGSGFAHQGSRELAPTHDVAGVVHELHCDRT